MTSTTPNTPANGGQILTDEQIDSAWVAINNGWGIVPRELIRKYTRGIEADLRAAIAAVLGKGEPEMWRVRYLCTAILNNCVVDETKRDARMVYDAIEGKSAAPAIPTVDRNAVLEEAARIVTDLVEGDANSASTLYDAAAAIRAHKSAAPASAPQPAVPQAIADAALSVNEADFDSWIGTRQHTNAMDALAGWEAHGRYVKVRVEKAIAVAQPAAQVAVNGMHEAADFIDRRAQKYLDENADTEFDTGAVVFHRGEAGRDYHSTLVELADDLRATPATVKTAEQSDTQQEKK